ncbi:MAG: cobyric acid synthase [Verrucomicrobiota bacterium]
MSSKRNNVHGGDPAAVAERLGLKETGRIRYDFSVNVNPLGPPPALDTVLSRAFDYADKYPPVYAEDAALALAEAHAVSPASVAVGNGSTEILSWILQALKPSRPAWVTPCYAGYREVCEATGLPGREINATGKDLVLSFDRLKKSDHDLVFLASPNNPTGTLLDPDKVLSAAREQPERWIVLDESFMDFTGDRSLSLIREGNPENIIVVKSLTKFFAIPGLRLGMLYCGPDIAAEIHRVRLPWSVNATAQAIAPFLYRDQRYIAETREKTDLLRDYISGRINDIPGWRAKPSTANFILVKLPAGKTAAGIQKELLEKGILVRSCLDFKGLGESYIRLAVRPQNETDALIEALQPAGRKTGAKTRAIMIAGTTSDSGKSVIAAALCRRLARQGVKVAPFKAQNMALNSGVTPAGGEMGRAQVVQAQACGIEPHTDMNPVLLKPAGENGSQVIVDGKPIGHFRAREYYGMKKEMKNAAHAAFDRLSGKYEMIVMEGAGSPAEINLMEEDFVNMSMAEYAGAKVILVADIDRGGVFASIFGTLRLLPQKYRKLIAGVIINRFRGDETLLEPGISEIEKLTGVPVLGVVPYIHDLQIEEEDSLGLNKRKGRKDALIDIVVIRFPRISNYTDFMPLELTEGVSVRYVSDPDMIGKPDLIILPGTKNTRADLQAMHKAGTSEVILEVAKAGTPVFGICGGYQMLGRTVSDPSGVEDSAGQDPGLGLLDLDTVLESDKELARVTGKIDMDLPFARAGTGFSGYEIHAGRSTMHSSAQSPLRLTLRRSQSVNEAAGHISENNCVFGCYIHGLFESSQFTEQLLNWLCSRKDLTPPAWRTAEINDFNMLADLLESKVDLSILANGN